MLFFFSIAKSSVAYKVVGIVDSLQNNWNGLSWKLNQGGVFLPILSFIILNLSFYFFFLTSTPL